MIKEEHNGNTAEKYDESKAWKTFFSQSSKSFPGANKQRGRRGWMLSICPIPQIIVLFWLDLDRRLGPLPTKSHGRDRWQTWGREGWLETFVKPMISPVLWIICHRGDFRGHMYSPASP